jgi:hypothetical protein
MPYYGATAERKNPPSRAALAREIAALKTQPAWRV